MTTLAAIVVVAAGIYLLDASWLAPAPAGAPRLLAHRGVHQNFDLAGVGNDTCTATRIPFPAGRAMALARSQDCAHVRQIAPPGESRMPVTQQFDLAPFRAVEISAGIEARVVSGRPQAVEAEASDQTTLGRLHLEVQGDTLFVSRRHGFLGFEASGYGRLRVSVSAPEIAYLAAGSGADTHFEGSPMPRLELQCASGSRLSAGSIDVDQLEAAAASGSTVVLAGRCGMAVLQSRSGAALDAGDLDCREIELDASSGSRVSAAARDAARINAASGASVRLRSRPARLDQRAAGGGSIRVG